MWHENDVLVEFDLLGDDALELLAVFVIFGGSIKLFRNTAWDSSCRGCEGR